MAKYGTFLPAIRYFWDEQYAIKKEREKFPYLKAEEKYTLNNLKKNPNMLQI